MSSTEPEQSLPVNPPGAAAGGATSFHGARIAVANLAWASLVVAGGLLLLLGVQTAQFGRPGLEKMLTELAMPMGLLWCMLVLAVSYGATRWWRGRRRGDPQAAAIGPLLSLSLGLWLAVTLFGNRSVATWAWDQTQYPISETLAGGEAGFFDAVILLGGGVGADPLDRPQLGGEGDRVRLPLQLWHAGRVGRIFVTGTSPLPDERGPADLTEELLISFGVPASAITRLAGRNTSEEMETLRETIPSLPSAAGGGAPRVGLVTSAFHMPRALRLARREGLEFVPLPASYHGGGPPIGWTRALVPTAGALEDLTACWKEWLAATVGR